MSRPGLEAEVPALQRDLLEIVDRYVELSRAGLIVQTALDQRLTGEMWTPCHAPAFTVRVALGKLATMELELQQLDRRY